jgi:2'-5' RNA ligase
MAPPYTLSPMAANTNPVPKRAEGALIVPVDVPVPVRRLRDRMDPAAAEGVPAHITLLYPFMPPTAVDEVIRRELERIIAAEPVFPFTLGRVERWPDVVYLAPEPDAPFRRLIAALIEAFPDYPPYGGVYDQMVPHLTIAQDPRPDWLAAAERALPAMLPIPAVAREALLLGHLPEQPWETHLHLPLGSAPAR